MKKLQTIGTLFLLLVSLASAQQKLTKVIGAGLAAAGTGVAQRQDPERPERDGYQERRARFLENHWVKTVAWVIHRADARDRIGIGSAYVNPHLRTGVLSLGSFGLRVGRWSLPI